MDALTHAEIAELGDLGPAFMRFDEDSNTLLIEDIELHLDLSLGDDLGVGLLVESLEEQYDDMVLAEKAHDEQLIALQSTKEWVNSNRGRLGGLFRYLKSLATD